MKKILIIIFMLFMAGSGYFLIQYGPSLGIHLIPPSPEKYAKDALRIMDRNGIYAGTPDWEEAKADALMKADTLSSYESAQSVLQTAIRACGGKHSRIVAPNEVLSPQEPILPTVEMADDCIASIQLPPFHGSHDQSEKYIRKTTEFIQGRIGQIRGVLLDLRHNTGGDMRPMIGAIAPLLSDPQDLLYFGISDQKLPLRLEDGCLISGSRTIWEKLETNLTDIPVAVIQDSLTGSSGEIVLLCFRGLSKSRSFGSPSAGYCSVNQTYSLYDGAQIILTTGTDISRLGEVFCEDPILPDCRSDNPEQDALTWLRSQISNTDKGGR